MGQIIQEILSEQRPETAYFLEDDGPRTGYVVNIDARVQLHPAMIAEDLARADIAQVVERFG